MRILITGGSGFIGSNIAKQLNRSIKEVTILDKNMLPTILVNDNFHFLNLDLNSEMPVIDHDVVIHLASQVGSYDSTKNPSQCFSTNVNGTINLCNNIDTSKVKKIIFASSMAVYGNGLSLKEDDPKEPQSPYGISKLASEKYLKYFCKENKIGLSIMRIFNCYGPGQNTQGNLKGLLNIFIEQVVNSNKINVMGLITRKRDLIYIDDVVSAFVGQVNIENSIKEYNVCTSKPTSINNMINNIITACNYDHKQFKIESININASYDPQDVVGDNTRLLDTGWYPSTNLKNGIIKCLKETKYQQSFQQEKDQKE